MLNPELPKNLYENAPSKTEEENQEVSKLAPITPEADSTVDLPEVLADEVPKTSLKADEEKVVPTGMAFSKVVEEVEKQVKETNPIHPKSLESLARLLQRIRSMEEESKKR